MKDSRHLKQQITDAIYYQIRTEGGDYGAERMLAAHMANKAMAAIEAEHASLYTSVMTEEAIKLVGGEAK